MMVDGWLIKKAITIDVIFFYLRFGLYIKKPAL